MKTFLSTLCGILFSSYLMAVTVTWNGGSGYWDDPANWSTGSVPGPGSDVIIQNGKVHISSVDLASAASVHIGPSSILVINGQLNLENGSDADAIVNEGSVVNGGFILIINYSSVSTPGTGHGIINEHKFFNGQSGTIVIIDTEQTAIENQASASFISHGPIYINNTQNYGIENDGFMLSSDYLVIDHTDEAGIENTFSGEFENRGDLSISIIGGHGIHNSGELTNNVYGDIAISGTSEDGINATPSSTFSNSGTLDIINTDGYGIYNYGTFSNASGAEIDIRQTDRTGLLNNSIFTQQGDLSISDVGGRGIQNYLDFTNSGPISIEETGSQGLFLAGGTFTNSSTLDIQDVNGGSGIVCYGGELENTTQGNLNVNDVALAGIQVTNITNSLLLNYGTMSLNNTGGDGINCSGNFTNFSTGDVSISNNSSGISLTLGGTITNSGTIDINQSINSSLVVQDGLFVNENGGHIEIADASFSQLDIRQDGHFINANASVNITDPSSFFGFYNQGEFENIECASIILEVKFSNVGNANFYNGAWLYTTYSGSNENTATLINEGVIGDYHGSFAGVSIQNNSIMTEPISANLQVGVAYPNALELAPINIVKVIGWYTDPSLSVKAGAYKQSTNTFTPNSNAAFATELFIEMYHYDDECYYIFPVKVTGNIWPFSAPESSGLDEAEGPEHTSIEVFPNPSSGNINIKTNNLTEGEYQIELFDAQGKRHFQSTVRLNLNQTQKLSLPNGMTPALYLLQISNEQGFLNNQRLIIK